MAKRHERERAWQVIRIRAKGEYIGTVTASDEASALKAALKTFALDKTEAERLLIRQYK
jgi:hypothetical protein